MKPLYPDGVDSRITHKLHNIYPSVLVPLAGLFIFSIFLCYFSPFKHLSFARASGTIQLPGHVPALVTRSQLLGPTDPNTAITLTVGLRLRNQASLESYVYTLDTASAPYAHPHLTLNQIVKAYGPLPSNQQAVIAYMQQAGFMVAATFKHHLMIGFHGTIAYAEQAFNIQIYNYREPDGRRFYARLLAVLVLALVVEQSRLN